MMDLSLVRNEFKDDGIFGAVYCGHTFFCSTLEHSYSDIPKIPPGIYKCIRGIHRLENGIPFETFEIVGVPEHTGLLFHKGNFNRDSKGCILLGLKREGDIIVESSIAFNKFMELQTGCDEFCLTVS